MLDFYSVARYGVYTFGFMVLTIVLNAIHQLLPKKKSEPPMVWHWIPFVGNAVEYGTDPLAFYTKSARLHGPIFTFILLGQKMTVYLGTDGNEFILNGRLQDVNTEEIYGPLTTPVFGRNIIYDCPNSKLMEQKKFVKFGLTQRALEQHVPLIEHEVLSYISPSSNSPSNNRHGPFDGVRGELDITHTMAEITIFTAGRALQGAEVRSKLTNEFAVLYDDLDRGFRPINFLIPWAPLPRNWARDRAHKVMTGVYMDIISRRRKARGLSLNLGGKNSEGEGKDTGGIVGRGAEGDGEEDMIDNLMSCTYKSGDRIPDVEVAHLMITLLMAGQHSSSSSSAWIMLRLASRPDIVEELYAELKEAGLGSSMDGKGEWRGLQYEDLERLPLLGNVVKETLRCHSSIHSVMRKVKNDMPVPGTDFVVTTDKVLIASPIVTHMSPEYFERPEVWDPHRWDAVVNDLDAKPDVDSDVNVKGGQADGKADTVDYGYGTVSKGTKSPYLPFGAGRHRCIGEKFAYVNLCTIVATLVREFKWEVAEGRGPGEVPNTDYSSLFSRPMPGARVRWERRARKEWVDSGLVWEQGRGGRR